MTAIIGLISGTSADGVDAALVDVCGDGDDVRIDVRAALTYAYAPEVRARVLSAAGEEPAPASAFAQLHVLVGHAFADAAHVVAERAGVAMRDVHAIGSHGQTIAHTPRAAAAHATWQIGDPAVIAERTGVQVVSDFRARDVAAGGEGAPLVPLLDYLVLRSDTVRRVALNIGGVANVTLLPAGCTRGDVTAFDTGPGNAVLDELVALASGGEESFDARGARAARGRVHEDIVARVLDDPYFAAPPPKSTGRDAFGRTLARTLHDSGVALGDLLATAVQITARSIAHAVRAFAPEEIVASGGGVHNDTLMRALREHVAPARVTLSDAYGLPADGKEAILFAVLAAETLHGRAGALRRVTGARRDVVLGSITPGRDQA